MSQQDFEITAADANTGITVRAAINAALQALASCSSGATEPATRYPYQWWADTTTGFLKQRNAANSAWITIINLANPGFAITAGKTITCTQNTSLDEAVAMSSKPTVVAWTDYFASSTIVGWAASPTGYIYTKKIGKTVFVQAYITGTSNSTAISFTLPYQSAAGTGCGAVCFNAVDNGTVLAVPCSGLIESGSSTFNLYKGLATGNWTASGTKSVSIQFFYEIA